MFSFLGSASDNWDLCSRLLNSPLTIFQIHKGPPGSKKHTGVREKHHTEGKVRGRKGAGKTKGASSAYCLLTPSSRMTQITQILQVTGCRRECPPPIRESRQRRKILSTWRPQFLHPQKKLPRKQYAFYLQEQQYESHPRICRNQIQENPVRGSVRKITRETARPWVGTKSPPAPDGML